MKRKGYPLQGKFGKYGGQFVPEILMAPLNELEEAYSRLKDDPEFKDELNRFLSNYAGRPTPLYLAEKLTKRAGGAKIYLKREDLLHGGAHKINNTLGQAILAKRMGKSRVIAETGAGQHGVAAAIACAVFGLRCEVYMGSHDIERQKLNVMRMKILGAEVHPVHSGSRTLKDAINEALRDWVTNLSDTYYLIGSVVGPHPYPMIVRDFQSVIGREIKEQILKAASRLPDAVVACVGGGSNAIGAFHAFLNDEDVELYGVEAGGKGIETGYHSASLSAGEEGVLHGMLTYLLQDKDGQITSTHSIAPGLDYPGVGPEHAFLKETGRCKYVSVEDKDAIEAFLTLSKEEGLLPALEPAHALAFAMKLAGSMERDEIVVINLSGRGDKDIEIVTKSMKGF